MEFDIQRFDEETSDAQAESSDAATEPAAEEQSPIPEELGGLPEEYAREVMEQSQAAQDSEPAPAEQPITREQYQAAINEANQLRTQLAQYQQPQQQQPAPQPQQQQPQAQQAPRPQFQPQPLKITPELAKQINDAISAEAKAMTGFSDDDVASLDYADDDDPRLAQWAQAKSLAKSRVYGAIQQAQNAQAQQAQQFYAQHAAAVKTYNEFVQKELKEPDFQAIQQFATNDFFNQLQPYEQAVIAQSYVRVERQIASPAEMLIVKNYYDRAKAAYRSRGRGGRRPAANNAPQPQLPRTDQLQGGSITNDLQLTTSEVERLLTKDFTTLPPKQQKALLGITD